MEGKTILRHQNRLLIMVQAVFLLFGALTVAWSAAIYFFLPNEPSSARFLDASDRKKAMTRVQENMTGIKNNTWKWSQSIEALLDVKIWLLVAIQVATNIANGGLHGVCASFLSYSYLADQSIVRLHRHQRHGLLDAEHFVGADAWPSIPRCIRHNWNGRQYLLQEHSYLLYGLEPCGRTSWRRNDPRS
jgi:hypothetical protein